MIHLSCLSLVKQRFKPAFSIAVAVRTILISSKISHAGPPIKVNVVQLLSVSARTN